MSAWKSAAVAAVGAAVGGAAGAVLGPEVDKKHGMLVGSLLGATLGAAGASALQHMEGKAAAALPPAQQNPIWAPVSPGADGSITIPASTAFALSMLGTNPNLAQVTTDLAAAITGTSPAVTPTAVGSTNGWPIPPGTPLPAGWPTQDQGGTVATRWLGATSATGPLTITSADAIGMSAFILTGFSS
jgi:uncharacterized membrane protein YfcA